MHVHGLPPRVTLCGILQPLLTSLLAYVALGEAPSRGALLGGPLIVLGLLLVTWAERRRG